MSNNNRESMRYMLKQLSLERLEREDAKEVKAVIII
jgi:hypothetical protein